MEKAEKIQGPASYFPAIEKKYGRPIAEWKAVDAQRRELQATLDNERAERNSANEKMSKLDKKSAEFTSARDRLKELSTSIKQGEEKLKALVPALNAVTI